MRLIDADEFFKNYPELAIEPYINAPTVEAIPTELHEKILDKAEGELLECQSHLRPKGEWVERTERITLDTYYECSNCKEPWTTIEGTPWQNMMNFCPNCGADMRVKGGKEE